MPWGGTVRAVRMSSSSSRTAWDAYVDETDGRSSKPSPWLSLDWNPHTVGDCQMFLAQCDQQCCSTTTRIGDYLQNRVSWTSTIGRHARLLLRGSLGSASIPGDLFNMENFDLR